MTATVVDIRRRILWADNLKAQINPLQVRKNVKFIGIYKLPPARRK